MAEEKQGFNIARITKEVERIYGIHNANVVNTVLKESGAVEIYEALRLLYELCQSGSAPGNDDLDKAFSALKKATE